MSNSDKEELSKIAERSEVDFDVVMEISDEDFGRILRGLEQAED